MAKITIGYAIGVVLIAATAVWQFSVAATLRTENVQLQQKLISKASVELTTMKQACSDRSQRYFTVLGYSESEAKNGTNTTFRDHYNIRLGRCLMTMDSTSYIKGDEIVQKNLIDTDEKTDFGQYAWTSSIKKRPYDVFLLQCKMSPPAKAETVCHSTEEYDNYINHMLSD